MSKLFLKVGITLLMFFSWSAMADKKNSDLKTEVSFEDLLVKGKYHFSDEAVTTVEDDKILDALLPVRKHFKDRIKRSARRH